MSGHALYSMVISVGATSLLTGLGALAVLIAGAHIVVSRLQGVAKAYGVAEVVIAVTVVSVGTSLPEIVAHLVASYRILGGTVDPQIASATVLGGNIGSDVVQQTLVLGLVVVAVGGFRFSRAFLLRHYAVMMGTTLLTLALAWDRVLSRFDGAVLLFGYVLYAGIQYRRRDEELQSQGDVPASDRPTVDLAVAVGALIVVVFSADIFLRFVESLVRETGLSGSLIGVVTLGVGSALPEMATAIAGLRQGAEGLSLGTLIGSNITNPLVAIGLGSVVSTYEVPVPLVYWDLPMETVTAAVLLVFLLYRDRLGYALAPVARAAGRTDLERRLSEMEDRRLTRLGAFFLAGMYVVYLVVRVRFFPHDFPVV